jgi:hypothetical protein
MHIYVYEYAHSILCRGIDRRMQSAITSMAYSSSSPSSTTSTSESTATTSAATQEAPSIQLVRRSSKDGHAMPSLYDIRGAEPAECSNLDSHHNPSSSSSCAAPERRCSVHLVAPASSVSASGSGAVTASVSPCAPMSVHASLAPHILYDVYGAACSPGSAAERIQLDSRGMCIQLTLSMSLYFPCLYEVLPHGGVFGRFRSI